MHRIEIGDLTRWLASAAVVLFAHASAAALVANWPDPVALWEPAGAITVDLAPLAAAPADARDDVAPGPQMQRAEAPPDIRPDDKVEEKPLEHQAREFKPAEPDRAEPTPIEPPNVAPAPPAPRPEVVGALPPPRLVRHRDRTKPRLSSPATTAPQRAPRVAALAAAPSQGQVSSSANAMASWKGQIVAQIERNKRYPAEAESRREQGAPSVMFSIDRHGRLLASRLARASGHAALDQEAEAILKRAQPFPPPPADLIGARFDFTVPIRFSVR